MTLTDEQIAELQALRAKMTAGPYETRGPTYIYGNLQNDILGTADRVATTVTATDASGIVALVNAAEPLLAEVLAGRAEIARLRGAVTEYRKGFGPSDGDSAALKGE